MTAHDPRVTLTEAERRSLVEPFQRWLMDPEAVELSGVMSRSVERIIDARLAPIRALAEMWASEPSTAWWGEGVRAAVDAASAASAPVSAQQDHDGAEGQGEGERAGGRDWRPMTEDVTDHAMTYAGQHPDGRACMYHHRLGIHVFGGNPTTECLRDHWATCCPTCGPTSTEQHPRRPGINRCANCKEWLR